VFVEVKAGGLVGMNVTILCDGLELETTSILTRNVRKFDIW
jgi:hypothetical protein